MTAQIGDPIYYKGKRWSLIAKTSNFRFNPRDFGLRPVSTCTACWDGYYCEYSITKNTLNIKRLWICLGLPEYVEETDEMIDYTEYPPILGIEAQEKSDGFLFDHCYDLNKKIYYTGKILLGRDFLGEYYEHMGYQQAWAYQTVYELEFIDGSLLSVSDYTKCVEELRRDFEKDPEYLEKFHSLNNVSFYVDNSFARDYENKAWWIEKYQNLKECLWKTGEVKNV